MLLLQENDDSIFNTGSHQVFECSYIILCSLHVIPCSSLFIALPCVLVSRECGVQTSKTNKHSTTTDRHPNPIPSTASIKSKCIKTK